MAVTADRSLGADFDRFIEAKVEAGAYESADDVLKAGLQLLQVRETKLEALRAALKEGEESGDYQEMDWEIFWAEMDMAEAQN